MTHPLSKMAKKVRCNLVLQSPAVATPHLDLRQDRPQVKSEPTRVHGHLCCLPAAFEGLLLYLLFSSFPGPTCLPPLIQLCDFCMLQTIAQTYSHRCACENIPSLHSLQQVKIHEEAIQGLHTCKAIQSS